MTPELEATAEDAYRIFGGYETDQPLTVCHCPCCMSKTDEHALLETPLRQIPSNLLAEYTNSAHGWDDGPIAREMRYFLPRYLELIAAGDPPSHLGLDTCLDRLGNAQWRENWPDAEVEVLDRFFDQFALAYLKRIDLEHLANGARLAFGFGQVLNLVVTAAGDLDRLLATWDAAEDPPAAIHMAGLRLDVADEGSGPLLCSPYLERDHREAAHKIGVFLMRPEATARIKWTSFEVRDDHQRFLSDVLEIGNPLHVSRNFCQIYGW